MKRSPRRAQDNDGTGWNASGTEIPAAVEVAVKIRTNPLASTLVLAALVAGTVAVPAGSVLGARGSQPAPAVFGDPDDGGQVRSLTVGDPDDGGELRARLVAFGDPDDGGQLV
jgi:hypothetical protein